jgi:hypothetical protein
LLVWLSARKGKNFLSFLLAAAKVIHFSESAKCFERKISRSPLFFHP